MAGGCMKNRDQYVIQIRQDTGRQALLVTPSYKPNLHKHKQERTRVVLELNNQLTDFPTEFTRLPNCLLLGFPWKRPS